MFDKRYYDYKFVGKDKGDGFDFIEASIFRFKTKYQRTYIVRLEEYRHNIRILKFYDKNHSDSENRYKMTFDPKKEPNDAIKVLGTCLNILVDTAKENPNASFGFIGENSLDESKEDTKRHRVYKRIVENFFDPAKWLHSVNKNTSTYLLINRNTDETKKLQDIKKMFVRIYPKLEF